MSAVLIVSVAVRRDDELLLVQEGKPHMRGRWNVPGGRVEHAERLVDAAVREVQEEAGLHVRVTALQRIHTSLTRTGKHCARFTFLGEVIGGTLGVDGQEILEANWFCLEDVERMPDASLWNPSQLRRILADLRAGTRYGLDAILETGLD